MSTSGSLEGGAYLNAWAKLTLSLRITGTRPDGYHLLESEMVSIDLSDALELGKGTGLTVVDEVIGDLGADGVPLDENLVTRALSLLGVDASVRLIKRIPPGSGLGGGSADAAAILRWAGADDHLLAARLGADVPFCVRGGRAMVRGIGEIIEPLPFEDRRYVLLVPPLSVSTAAAYRAWDDGAAGSGESNDLEQAALKVEPALAAWRDLLGEATGERPHLAGSGSTWFVEGDVEDFGLSGKTNLELGHESGALVAVRTVKGVPIP